MSYVDELLADGEQIKLESHQHPFVFLSRIVAETVLLIILGSAFGFIISQSLQSDRWIKLRPYILAVLGLIALVVLASAVFDFLKWRNDAFILTDRRVIHLRGIVNKSTVDSSLEKINDVQMRQTFWGRMFNYGDLEIQTASDNGDNYLQNIRAPLEFKRAMLNAKSEHDIPMAYRNDPAAQQSAPQPTMNQRLSTAEIEEQLVRLADLRQKNLITDDDFNAKKREILSRM